MKSALYYPKRKQAENEKRLKASTPEKPNKKRKNNHATTLTTETNESKSNESIDHGDVDSVDSNCDTEVLEGNYKFDLMHHERLQAASVATFNAATSLPSESTPRRLDELRALKLYGQHLIDSTRAAAITALQLLHSLEVKYHVHLVGTELNGANDFDIDDSESAATATDDESNNNDSRVEGQESEHDEEVQIEGRQQEEVQIERRTTRAETKIVKKLAATSSL